MFSILPQFYNSSIHEQPCQQVKRRRLAGESSYCDHYDYLSQYHPSVRRDSVSVKYDLHETSDSYYLTLSKKINKEKIENEINSKLNELKEKYSQPNYTVVTDFFGNQYYVEQKPSNDDENNAYDMALNELDANGFINQLAEKEYEDYEINLSRRGDAVELYSQKDNISKEWSLEENVGNIKFLGTSFEDEYYSDEEDIIYPKNDTLLFLLKIQLIKKEQTFTPEYINNTIYHTPKSSESESLGSISLPHKHKRKHRKSLDKKSLDSHRRKHKKKATKSKSKSRHHTKSSKMMIDINIRHDEKNSDVSTNSINVSFSPVLEDVEDEELKHYHDTLLIPLENENSIIEDI